MAGQPGPSGKGMRSGTASGFPVDTIGQMQCSHGPPQGLRINVPTVFQHFVLTLLWGGVPTLEHLSNHCSNTRWNTSQIAVPTPL